MILEDIRKLYRVETEIGDLYVVAHDYAGAEKKAKKIMVDERDKLPAKINMIEFVSDSVAVEDAAWKTDAISSAS